MPNDEPGHGFSPGSSAAISHLMFRPAEPDELGRAASLCQPDAVRQGEGAMQCFVAVRSLPVERLMAVVFWKTIPETDETLTAEFQWSALPAMGAEVSTFLQAFIAHVAAQEPAVTAIAAAEWLSRENPTAAILEGVGFVATINRSHFHADAAAWRAALADDATNREAPVSPHPSHFPALRKLLCGSSLRPSELAHGFLSAASASPSLFDVRCSAVMLDDSGAPVAACLANSAHGQLALAALLGTPEACRALLCHCLQARDHLPEPEALSFHIDDSPSPSALAPLMESLPHQLLARRSRFICEISDADTKHHKNLLPDEIK